MIDLFGRLILRIHCEELRERLVEIRDRFFGFERSVRSECGCSEEFFLGFESCERSRSSQPFILIVDCRFRVNIQRFN
ncbi:hypothetical protein HanRHA438_Chr09g0410821 [Helianthus annuus]|nr:hypothetical protein HanRHA438_Chr09g0410821 [Helianthus annuus]